LKETNKKATDRKRQSIPDYFFSKMDDATLFHYLNFGLPKGGETAVRKELKKRSLLHNDVKPD
jgi:hypothetical protein